MFPGGSWGAVSAAPRGGGGGRLGIVCLDKFCSSQISHLCAPFEPEFVVVDGDVISASLLAISASE